MIKAINMLIQCIYVVVAAVGYVIDAVTEIAGTIQHGDAYLLQLVNNAVIISKSFHIKVSILS